MIYLLTRHTHIYTLVMCDEVTKISFPACPEWQVEPCPQRKTVAGRPPRSRPEAVAGKATVS